MKPVVEIWRPDWKCTIEEDMRDLTKMDRFISVKELNEMWQGTIDGMKIKDLTKHKTWRSQEYLDWVKTQPSCISGLPADDAHHVKGHGMGGTVKAPDWAAIPLTRGEHSWFHSPAGGCMTWEKIHGNQLEHVARTLGRAIELGILSIQGDKS